MRTLSGRNMYIWKLAPVLAVELGVNGLIRKAKAAKLSGIWIKIADGRTPYANVIERVGESFLDLRKKLAGEGISVWGWQVPYGPTIEVAIEEARLASSLSDELNLD